MCGEARTYGRMSPYPLVRTTVIAKYQARTYTEAYGTGHRSWLKGSHASCASFCCT